VFLSFVRFSFDVSLASPTHPIWAYSSHSLSL
jgi:hypothetical protein